MLDLIGREVGMPRGIDPKKPKTKPNKTQLVAPIMLQQNPMINYCGVGKENKHLCLILV